MMFNTLLLKDDEKLTFKKISIGEVFYLEEEGKNDIIYMKTGKEKAFPLGKITSGVPHFEVEYICENTPVCYLKGLYNIEKVIKTLNDYQDDDF